MGNGLKVGQTYQKSVAIESNCPVSFEYKIEEFKPHPDVRIMPLSGDIVGNGLTTITFMYTPTTFTTADCEFLIKTSEFDF